MSDPDSLLQGIGVSCSFPPDLSYLVSVHNRPTRRRVLNQPYCRDLILRLKHEGNAKPNPGDPTNTLHYFRRNRTSIPTGGTRGRLGSYCGEAFFHDNTHRATDRQPHRGIVGPLR